MNFNSSIWTYGFQHEYYFPNENVQLNTLRAGERGVENHVPKEMLPVLIGIVKAYNDKFREQEVTFQEQLHALSDEIMLLRRQIHYLARHLPPGLQLPPPED